MVDRLMRERCNRLLQEKKGFLRYRQPFERLRRFRAKWCDFSGDTVCIGKKEELPASQRDTVRHCLEAFMPWRKGPFDIFGVHVDAEWQSQRKWDRLLPELPELAGAVVADIGCNNGYYMFRMAHHRPRCVLGFEPMAQHYFTFRSLNAMAGCDFLHILPLGVEHTGFFANSFDCVFLMGVLYHRANPLECLHMIRSALKPGGTILVESMAIPGDESVALFPEKRYGKMPGVYFIPTGSCLVNWLKRAGFAAVKLFCSHPMTGEEQRRTPWMTFESFHDFISRKDPARTCEGHPAPIRVFVRAFKD